MNITLLVAAGGLAGSVNAIAGGGTFLTFAALSAVGLPPVAANATSVVSVLPGQVASALAYRRELSANRRLVLHLAIVSGVGGIAGGWLLLHSSAATFKHLVPWLLLGSTLLFAGSPLVVGWTARRPGAERHGACSVIGALALQGLVAVYGGYFGAGIGVVMLASLSLTFGSDFHASNAAKNFLAALMQGCAAILFVVAGIVHWREAALVVVSGIAGGWLGVRLAHRVKTVVIRAAVVGTGLALTLWFATV